MTGIIEKIKNTITGDTEEEIPELQKEAFSPERVRLETNELFEQGSLSENDFDIPQEKVLSRVKNDAVRFERMVIPALEQTPSLLDRVDENVDYTKAKSEWREEYVNPELIETIESAASITTRIIYNVVELPEKHEDEFDIYQQRRQKLSEYPALDYMYISLLSIGKKIDTDDELEYSVLYNVKERTDDKILSLVGEDEQL